MKPKKQGLDKSYYITKTVFFFFWSNLKMEEMKNQFEKSGHLF